MPIKAAIQRRLRSSFARTLVVRLLAVRRDGGFLALETLSVSSELSRMEEMRASVRCRHIVVSAEDLYKRFKDRQRCKGTTTGKVRTGQTPLQRTSCYPTKTGAWFVASR